MTDAGTSSIVAAISAILLETIGVDAHTVAVACVGAVGFQAFATETIGRTRAMVQVAVGGVIGALLGKFSVDIAHHLTEWPLFQTKPALALAAAFFGWSYYFIFEALRKRAQSEIGKK